MSSLRVFFGQFRLLHIFSVNTKSRSLVTNKCLTVNFVQQNSKYTKRVRMAGRKGDFKSRREFDQANFDSEEVLWDDDEADEKLQKQTFYDINDESPALTDSQRWNLKMKIIKKKYFRDDPDVSVLTWEAKEQIRFLHFDAPDNWTVESLAESFPVSERGVKRILQSTFKPKSLSEVQLYNERVRKRWLAFKLDLESGNEDRSSEFNYLLEPNKLKVLSYASGNPDLPMPKELYSRETTLIETKETGIFTSIVKDYQLAIAEKSDKLENRKLTDLDCHKSDAEMLSEIKLLAGVKNGDVTKASNLCEIKEYDSMDLKQNGLTLSRRQRRLAADGETVPTSIDLATLPAFESYQTRKISHKVYNILSNDEIGNKNLTDIDGERDSKKVFTPPQPDEQFNFQHFHPTMKNTKTNKHKSVKRFKNSFKFMHWY